MAYCDHCGDRFAAAAKTDPKAENLGALAADLRYANAAVGRYQRTLAAFVGVTVAMVVLMNDQFVADRTTLGIMFGVLSGLGLGLSLWWYGIQEGAAGGKRVRRRREDLERRYRLAMAAQGVDPIWGLPPLPPATLVESSPSDVVETVHHLGRDDGGW